ncbi:MAG: serine/threonine-protein kinase, partial [Kiritimatiellae bacterium]|nr:serine/threonine-protein kinase [Kiritimatiellia bacterium]
SVAGVHKVLEGMDCLVLAVGEVSKARHLLLNVSIDVWVCDLAAANLDFRALHAEALGRNPHMCILLTGPALTQPHAAALIKDKLANRFVPKAWPRLTIKHAMLEMLHQVDEAQPAAGGQAAVHAKHIETPSGPASDKKVHAPVSQKAVPLQLEDERYRLDEQLGEGGTGRVYRAFDQLLDMEVAVKLLNPELARDENAIQSLKAETRICLQLLHKHIVRLYNLERREDLFLIIMEFVRGCTLHQLIKQNETLPPLMVLQIVTVITDALHYAHKHGVLHKDLTPGNVLISDDGLLKVIDFGIADMINRQRDDHDYVVGTPAYMSPEQLRGEALDVRTDVYSLGVLTYQILTGRLPSSPEATIEDLAFRPHPPLAGLPYPVLQVLELATALEPDRRWPSISRFGTAFAAACSQEYGIRLDEG